MKYEKNQYTEGASVCGFIIAGGFLWWGINDIIDLSWIGILWIGIGIAILSGEIAAIANKKKLRAAVRNAFIDNPNTSVEEICNKTGISKKDVRAIILDLKAQGELQGSFSPHTGQLSPSKSARVEQPAPKPVKFCAACGAELEPDASFCTYCGAKSSN